MYMLRFTRTTPLELPGIFSVSGTDQGRVSFLPDCPATVSQGPFFQPTEISLHPTKNLEIGFTRSSIWAGAGHPFTATAWDKSVYSGGPLPAIVIAMIQGTANPG